MAGRALTVQLKFVCGDMEVVLASDLFLQRLDIAILEFDNRSTFRADHVVVMSLVGHVVIVCLGSEVPLLRESTLAKKVESTVDGRESDMRFTFGQLMVELFGSDMFHPQKGLEDNLALAGHSQFMMGEVLSKNCDLFLYGFFGRASRHHITSLVLIMNLFIIPFVWPRQGMIVEIALFTACLEDRG